MQQRMDDAEILRRLDRALRRVPRRTRQIFLAHVLDGLSYAEVAQRDGLGVREVERHVAAALVAIDWSLTDPRRRWQARCGSVT